jgi:hypothetical protein
MVYPLKRGESEVTTPNPRVAEIEAWLLGRIRAYDIQALQPENRDHRLALEEAWEKFAPEHWVANPEARSFRVHLPTKVGVTNTSTPLSASAYLHTSPTTYILPHEGPVPLSWPLLSRILADPQAVETAEQLRLVLLTRLLGIPLSFLDRVTNRKQPYIKDHPPRWSVREVRRTLDVPTKLPTFPRAEEWTAPTVSADSGVNLCAEVAYRATRRIQVQEDQHAWALMQETAPLLSDYERRMAEDLRGEWDRNFDPSLNVFDPLVQLYDLGFSLSDVEDFGSKAPLLVNVEW